MSFDLDPLEESTSLGLELQHLASVYETTKAALDRTRSELAQAQADLLNARRALCGELGPITLPNGVAYPGRSLWAIRTDMANKGDWWRHHLPAAKAVRGSVYEIPTADACGQPSRGFAVVFFAVPTAAMPTGLSRAGWDPVLVQDGLSVFSCNALILTIWAQVTKFFADQHIGAVASVTNADYWIQASAIGCTRNLILPIGNGDPQRPIFGATHAEALTKAKLYHQGKIAFVGPVAVPEDKEDDPFVGDAPNGAWIKQRFQGVLTGEGKTPPFPQHQITLS